MKIRTRHRLLWAVVLAIIVVLTTAAAGQTFRGGIQGTVTDTTGGALANAEVTATNLATGLIRTVQSDKAGHYYIPELPLGDYAVTVILGGFGPQTVSGVHIAVSAFQRVNLQLAPGGVQGPMHVGLEGGRLRSRQRAFRQPETECLPRPRLSQLRPAAHRHAGHGRREPLPGRWRAPERPIGGQADVLIVPDRRQHRFVLPQRRLLTRLRPGA